MGTRHVHARRPRGGREQPLADGEGARAVRGPAVRPRLPSPRADQALSLRFVPEAAGPLLRGHLAGPRRRPRTHAAGNARRANVRDRPRGPGRGSGGLRLADRGGPRRPRLLPEHERPRQGARPRALGVVRRERVLVPEAVRPEGGPRGLPRDVPRPPRPVPNRRRRAIQGIPRRGDVGPTVRRPERPVDRGVGEGCITLLQGEAGSGKANFCLQLARNVVRAGHKVIYIDTEGVSLDRLQQMCDDDFDVVVKNILFSEPYSFEEQEKRIEEAVKLADGNPNVGLIVIDSITMHYRLTMRDETRRDERYGLTRQIAKLLRSSRVRGIPVVVTSQVYTDIETGAYMPLGGHMLSHNAKTIVRFERTGISTRAAVLMKHRHREEGARAAFRIRSEEHTSELQSQSNL